MRKFCIKYSQSHPRHEEVRLSMVRIHLVIEFEQALAQHYSVHGPGQYVPREVHRSQQEC